ncbi:HEPN domain-containing protein [Paenibacillus sp. P96]|uniref:HEPN domain-containing protein n=1 Tax=Paenibacillus zeirhizosphaerae TaxID=2987519 RepID=A0ABT9FRK1_9BACL|nr:HEPN domain-containing protein [Paenibacillus sp. P96]MDP4097365.1 HEPN domain-containing protein [Paenibacillus sp. P96]
MDRQTKEWLRFATNDYELSMVAATQNKLENGCYLLQQSAEKYLKSIEVYLNLGISKTHLLSRLCKSIESAGITVPVEVMEASFILESYATTARYPGYDINLDDMSKCIASHAAIKSYVEKYFSDKTPKI